MIYPSNLLPLKRGQTASSFFGFKKKFMVIREPRNYAGVKLSKLKEGHLLSETRLKQMEAELAIRNVIARYGLAVDCGHVAAALQCHTKEAIYIVSDPNAGRVGEGRESGGDMEMKGHEAIADMLPQRCINHYYLIAPTQSALWL